MRLRLNQRTSSSVAAPDSLRQGLLADRDLPAAVSIENELAAGRVRRSADPTQSTLQSPNDGLIESSSDISASQRPGRWNEGEIASLKRLIVTFSTTSRVDWVALMREWQSLAT